MEKKKVSKLQLKTSTVRKLESAAAEMARGGQKPGVGEGTGWISVLLLCSWYCATASCFVDDTCGIHGCAPGGGGGTGKIGPG
jgi:hypothetical protein